MSPEPITELLTAAGRNDPGAHERLWGAIYDELHALARRQLAAERPGGTLQPTALIHEAYIRLFGGRSINWANRRQFFAAAAKSMRQIRVDYARRRKSLKRSGGNPKAHIQSEAMAIFDDDPAELLAIEDALCDMEKVRPRLAEIVTLRFFAGLSIAESAEALDVSPRTVDADWRLARAWLHRRLAGGRGPS